MANETATSKVTTVFRKFDSGEDSSEDDSFEDMYTAAEIGIPFAITIIVIVVLCATVAYTKYRKRRMLQNMQNGMIRMPAISGGVPMSAAAYQNQAFQATNIPQSNQHLSPPPMYIAQPQTTNIYNFQNVQGPVIVPTLPAYQEVADTSSAQPPRYDDIVKECPNVTMENEMQDGTNLESPSNTCESQPADSQRSSNVQNSNSPNPVSQNSDISSGINSEHNTNSEHSQYNEINVS